MIPRFTMRQALSAPDLLGNALVTPPLPAWCRLLGQQPRDRDFVGERGPLVNQALACLPATVPAFDWVDIVHAAPIPLAFDLRATRRCQMIEQVRQWVFRPIAGD